MKTGSRVDLKPGEYVVTVVTTEPVLPSHYASAQTSDLRVTVAPGKNRIDLPLWIG